jgi:UDP-N-acetylglucosamine 1-carboxyvinyltransferase
MLMEKFIITGGNTLQGNVSVSGAKNAALKLLVAACLTNEKVIIHNVPRILDVFIMLEILQDLGASVAFKEHTVTIHLKQFAKSSIPLDKAALVRTASLLFGPLLYRTKEAIIPNPGGCRLGARPIDRTIHGIEQMNAVITYHHDDGYFHAKTDGLTATTYHFEKSTHTGTETLILAAVVAKGKTILTNAAEEPEIDDLIALLNKMGGNIKRSANREITIIGVDVLHGAEFTISPDRIEVATFAIAAILTGGDVFIKDAQKAAIDPFLKELQQTGAGFEKTNEGIRFYATDRLDSVPITTGIHPGFLTDWQALWAVLMTQAKGTAIIHETVFENKLGYIADLKKMGADAILFNPEVKDPEAIYNFNLADDSPDHLHAVEIKGQTPLHNAIMTTLDIRAGAAMVLAALIAQGTSTIYGIEKLDRGYEALEKRLSHLGANIQRVQEE